MVYNEPTFPALVSTLSDRRLCSEKTLVYLATMLVRTCARVPFCADQRHADTRWLFLFFVLSNTSAVYVHTDSSSVSWKNGGVLLDLAVGCPCRRKRFRSTCTQLQNKTFSTAPGRPESPPLLWTTHRQLFPRAPPYPFLAFESEEVGTKAYWTCSTVAISTSAPWTLPPPTI